MAKSSNESDPSSTFLWVFAAKTCC